MICNITKKNYIQNTIGFVLFMLSAWGGVIIFKSLLGIDLWYDEIFSVVYSKTSFENIVMLTAGDVHPPFYYIYLKLMVMLLSRLWSAAPYEILCKIASFVPFIVLYIIALTSLRRRFGLQMAGMFMFLITFMPQLNNYYVEIRMYSLCLLFITICMLAVEGIMRNGRIIHFILLYVFGILTAYTQYYACIGVIGVYLILLIYICISLSKKNEAKSITEADEKTQKSYVINRTRPTRQLISFSIIAVLSIISYLPWIPYFIGQVTRVSSNYWIQPLTLRNIAGCIKYIYLPVSGDGRINMIMALLMIAISALIVVGFLSLRPLWKERLFGFSGIIILALVVLAGFVLSIINRPIFVYRYMIPVIGIYYMSLSYMADYSLKRKNGIFIIGIIPFIIGARLNMNGYIYEEGNKINNMGITLDKLSTISKEAVIITNFDQVTTVLDYYMPENEIYLYDWETDPAVQAMFGKDSQKLSDVEFDGRLNKLLSEGKEVYFFGSFNQREELLKDWEARGFDYEEMDSCLIERYWFNIYRLEKQM